MCVLVRCRRKLNTPTDSSGYAQGPIQSNPIQSMHVPFLLFHSSLETAQWCFIPSSRTSSSQGVAACGPNVHRPDTLKVFSSVTCPPVQSCGPPTNFGSFGQKGTLFAPLSKKRDCFIFSTKTDLHSSVRPALPF